MLVRYPDGSVLHDAGEMAIGVSTEIPAVYLASAIPQFCGFGAFDLAAAEELHRDLGEAIERLKERGDAWPA